MALLLHHTYGMIEERARPTLGDNTRHYRPFFAGDRASARAAFVAHLAYAFGHWSDVLSPEETALALAQVTAAAVLPPLTHLASGSELLAYQVRLRDRMDSALVDELNATLNLNDPDSNWKQIEARLYACVVGAGVAAVIDTTPGSETLTLRYANALVPALCRARQVAELPRSLLFLQSILYERFDELLEEARARLWFWLAG